MKQMPKFGMITNPTKEIISEINRAHKLGMDYVEIGIEPPKAAPKDIVKKKNRILKALKKFSHPPLIHTVYWCELGDSYEKIRESWIDEMKKEIIIASKLKAKIFGVHFNAKGVLHEETYLKMVSDNYIKSLRELVKFAKRYGIKITLENTPYPYSDFKNYRYLIDRVPGLYVHLDLGHVFITDRMKGFNKFFSYFNKKIEHIHIHDNYGLTDDHLVLNDGKINFALVVKELKKIKYNKTITFEIHTSNKDLIKSVKIFKRLWS